MNFSPAPLHPGRLCFQHRVSQLMQQHLQSAYTLRLFEPLGMLDPGAGCNHHPQGCIPASSCDLAGFGGPSQASFESRHGEAPAAWPGHATGQLEPDVGKQMQLALGEQLPFEVQAACQSRCLRSALPTLEGTATRCLDALCFPQQPVNLDLSA